MLTKFFVNFYQNFTLCHRYVSFQSATRYPERCTTVVKKFRPPKCVLKMYLTCDDLKLCTDQFAYCTDNPLAGKRCGYRPRTRPPAAGGRGLRNGSAAISASPYDLNERVAEVAAALPASSVLNVSCLVVNDTLIYLLGTDHVNPKCQQEVNEIISMVKPNKVIVELCKYRACRCSSHMDSIFQNPAQFTFSYLKKVVNEIGFVPAFIFMADVFNEMEAAGNVNLEFGGEMTGAIRQAKNVHHCQLLLGDRPIAITIKRRASAMNWWTRVQLIAQVFLGLAFKSFRRILLSSAHRVAGDDAMTYYIFVFERDLCLVNAIQLASGNTKPGSKIVAVVGGGHTKGIHRYWGKMTPEIARIIYESKFNFKYV